MKFSVENESLSLKQLVCSAIEKNLLDLCFMLCFTEVFSMKDQLGRTVKDAIGTAVSGEN